MKFFQLALGAMVLLVAPISAQAVTAVASVYWPGDGVVKKHDYRTSSGERYSETAMTCAHKTFPLGTKLIVRYGDNYAEVKVNDRGPFIKGRDIDLTPGVAKSLHFSGLGRVRIEYFPPLPQPRPTDLP
jgi:peptidoglycan lytic transglycosylase